MPRSSGPLRRPTSGRLRLSPSLDRWTTLALAREGGMAASAIDRALAPGALSLVEFCVLAVIRDLDGECHQQSLVERLGYHRSTISNALWDLEDDGQIARRGNKLDGRRRRVQLTGGLDALTEAEARMKTAEASFFAHMRDTERAALHDLLQRLRGPAAHPLAELFR